MLRYLLTLLSIVASFGSAQEGETSPKTVKVHFIPHSHMDAGWLLTYDGYYG